MTLWHFIGNFNISRIINLFFCRSFFSKSICLQSETVQILWIQSSSMLWISFDEDLLLVKPYGLTEIIIITTKTDLSTIFSPFCFFISVHFCIHHSLLKLRTNDWDLVCAQPPQSQMHHCSSAAKIANNNRI